MNLLTVEKCFVGCWNRFLFQFTLGPNSDVDRIMERVRRFAPRSGVRMQPTAQALGQSGEVDASIEGAKEGLRHTSTEHKTEMQQPHLYFEFVVMKLD